MEEKINIEVKENNNININQNKTEFIEKIKTKRLQILETNKYFRCKRELKWNIVDEIFTVFH